MSIPRIAGYPMPASAPAGRLQWPLEPNRAALLVHDLQDYFLDFYDRAAEPIPELLANVGRLLAAARRAGIPVYYTAQPAEQGRNERGLLNDLWGPGLTAHPQRQAIAAAIAPQDGDTVLVKWRYSAFQKSDFEALLRAQGRDQLLVCGVYAHIGCLMTACEAFMKDIRPFVVADALADFSLREHQMALDYVAQRCGRVLLADEVLAACGVSALSGSLPGSLSALAAEVAQSLQLTPGELPHDASLMDWGLDSIRVMAFVERWRQAGRDISFVQLAETPTLEAWWSLLQQAPALAE